MSLKSKLNKNLHDEIVAIHKNKKSEIEKTIQGYKDAWQKSERDIFAEVAFCILTPQSKAKSAWKAIEILVANDLLYIGNSDEMVEFLNIVRFKNNKAKYLVELRNTMMIDGEVEPKKILESKGNTLERREWIIENIKGMGVKEASHMLRNLGFGKDIAILDRHILRNILNLNIIDEIPKTLSKKKYYELEEKMREYSKFSKIPMDELDLVLWYKEAGEFFK